METGMARRGRMDMPPGPGRPKGAPNKATVKAKEAIAAFVDGNSDRIQSWLDEIYATKGAEAALNAFHGFLEFHVPKLARTEITGESGAPLFVIAAPAVTDDWRSHLIGGPEADDGSKV